MLENPLRRSARNPASTPTGIRRPDSPAIKPQRVGPPLAPASPSFAQRKAHQPRPYNAVFVEGNNVMRSIDRPLPGDVVGRQKPQLHPDISRKKSAYFESEFAATNRGDDPAKARILNEAMVTAELKTNVIIRDEFTFITDLAYHLSNRYQRPMSSINITLHHGICMLFAGTFEPACTLTIHAIPSLLQPVTNKRNAVLIQQHLHETLGVLSTRGYVRFEATPEENVAIGGKTLAAEVEELSKGDGDRKSSVFRKPSVSGRGIMNSVKSLGNFKSASMIDLAGKVPTPPPSNSGETTRGIATIPEVPPTPPADERSGQEEEHKPRKGALRRKSLRFALFGNKASPDKR
ncbi:Tautomerase/MIF [Xylariaceae sp. AK1471]|nr:Tautomerase/MIF [Xylariaceae sp. AK1471]